MQLSRDELTKAYRGMRTIRAFEDRLHVELAKGEIPGNAHLYAGQEACAVGVCMHLADTDFVSSTHRGHGHCIAKGCDTTEMMLEIYAREGGLCGGKGGSMHIADFDKGMIGANGIVGAAPPLICGAALSAKTLKTGAIAVTFIGDGAANQGATLEAMNLAAVLKLPMIFAIEDNGWGEAAASSWAVAGDISKRAEGYGIPSYRADGADFFAVHEAAGEAVARARAGDGPSVLHLTVDRFYGHFEGDAQSYRAPGELAEIRRDKDPLVRFRRRVTEAGLLEAEQLDAIDSQADRQIDNDVKVSLAAPHVSVDTLTTDVYLSY
jgi:TPP-dependent pyruvate/acetoin dehydrogenase alpha subunit